MKKQKNSGCLQKFFLALIFIIFSIFYINLPAILFANSEPIPISGTPKLRQQNYQFILENSEKLTIQAEKNTGIILQDILYQENSFWAFDFNYPSYDPNGYYLTRATCQNVTILNSGYYLYIYVEKGLNLSSSTVNYIKDEFTKIILPAETVYFGSPPAKDLTILILDIKDDYNPYIGNTTYVSGYFDYNYPSIIYLDANPGVPGSITSLGTLAHEFQHLIHYYYDPLEETWVNEGLSGLARYVCGYGHPAIDSSQRKHIEAFAKYPNTSLTIWDDSLANYGATYLFMLYLAKNYGDTKITRNIVANRARGISGITNALWQSGYAVNFNNLFRNWVIANYLNNSYVYDGIYGYNDNFDGIYPAPGKLQVSKTHISYPANGSGSINPYAAEYINFGFLGGIYDIFVLVAHSISGGSYTYSGSLGSLFLRIDGVNDQMRMSGIQESTTQVLPIVLPDLYTDNKISSFGGLLWDNSGGGCFIATAVYGSPIAKEIIILREFRDRFLLTNDWGRKIVNLYYRHSPTLARFISQSEKLRSATRILIYPAVGLSYVLVRYPLSLFISLIILCGLLFKKFFTIKRKKAIILPDD